MADQDTIFLHYMETHNAKLRDNLHMQWEQVQFCDLILRSGPEEIATHACVMAAFSRTVASQIMKHEESGGKKCDNLVINVTFSYGALKTVITALYTGIFSPSKAMLSEILTAVKWFELDDLVSVTEELMSSMMCDIGEELENTNICEVIVKTEPAEPPCVNSHLAENSFQIALSSSETLREIMPDNSIVCDVGELIPATRKSSRKRKLNTSKYGDSAFLNCTIPGVSAVLNRDPHPAIKAEIDSAEPHSDHTHPVLEGTDSTEISQKKTKKDNKKCKSLAGSEDKCLNDGQEQNRHLTKNTHSSVSTLKTVSKRKPAKPIKLKISPDLLKNIPGVVVTSFNKEKRKGYEVSRSSRANGKGDKSERKKLKPNGKETKEARVQMKITEKEKVKQIQKEEINSVSPITEGTGDPLMEINTRVLDFITGKSQFLQCHYCQLKFNSRTQYKEHMYTHRTFICIDCGASFYRRFNLTWHRRRIHIGIHHLTCHQCGITTKTEADFRKHALEVHQDKKPFHCTHEGCSYKSWKFDNISKHMTIHSDTMEYACIKCGQSFAQCSGLISHQRSCYRLQQYLCDLCGQAFNHPARLKAHRQTIHFGEKPYKCKECGNSFSDHRNLGRHMRIHQNVFPYSCPVCKKQFRHSNSLKAHVKKHKDFDEALLVPSSNKQPRNKLGGANYKRQALGGGRKARENIDFNGQDQDGLSLGKCRKSTTHSSLFPQSSSPSSHHLDHGDPPQFEPSSGNDIELVIHPPITNNKSLNYSPKPGRGSGGDDVHRNQDENSIEEEFDGFSQSPFYDLYSSGFSNNLMQSQERSVVFGSPSGSYLKPMDEPQQ